MWRVDVVGRYPVALEHAARPDLDRPEYGSEHHAVLGFGHRRLLHHERADGRALRALVSVLGVQRVVPLARAHLAPAHALGLGPERDGFPGRAKDSACAAGYEQP